MNDCGLSGTTFGLWCPTGHQVDVTIELGQMSFATKHILALSVGATAVCLFACNGVNTATHFADKNSPYSILEGKSIRVKPYDATFDIPESWLTPQTIPGEPNKNLFLSSEELNYLYSHDGHDAEDAEVINSVLSFQDCAAHVGDKGWGNYLWNDLQGRVYITDLTPGEISARVERQGVAKASTVFEHVSVISGHQGAWDRRTLDILDAPPNSDFSLGKALDFYYRSFDNKTVIFVFLHAGGFDETINGIINSFKWPARQLVTPTPRARIRR